MSRYRMQALAIAFCLFALFLNGGCAHAGGRVALVIGNGAYKSAAKLESSRDDADAIAALLMSIGFKVVEGLESTRDTMSAKLLDFSKRTQGADVAIFFYAGHGIAVDGVNYLLPVDADIKSVADVKLGAAINIDDALDQTMQGAKVKLVFLDMSRANPFALTAGRQRFVPSGLAKMKEADNTLTAFATGLEQPAQNGPKGGHSPFTQALLDNIATPGVEIQQAMTVVLAQVRERTNNQQRPSVSTNLVEEIYLKPPVPPPAPREGK